MGQNAILAHIGGSFQVSLRSVLGSSNYGWVLSNLPEGIVFAGYEVISVHGGIGPVNQIFHFGVADTNNAENSVIQLIFHMVCFSDFTISVDEVVIDVLISKEESDTNNTPKKVIQYENNSAIYNAQMPYGFPLTSESVMKALVPSDEDKITIKYGYPDCLSEDASAVKYGAPCDEPVVEYGLPEDSTCEKPAMRYGAPCEDPATVKYGAPCDEATVKYGAPCDEATVKYGAPCNEENAGLAYGFKDCE